MWIIYEARKEGERVKGLLREDGKVYILDKEFLILILQLLVISSANGSNIYHVAGHID